MPDVFAASGITIYEIFIFIYKDKMKDIFENLKKSFDNTEDGYSSRKLTAFAIIICVIAAHIKWLSLGNLTQLEAVLTIDYGFIAALFGMTTYSSIKKDLSSKDQESIK